MDCKHIFCESCYKKLQQTNICIRCKRAQNTKVKLEHYLPLNLCGYSLGYLHDKLKEATDFFFYQIIEEMLFLKYQRKELKIEAAKYKQKYNELLKKLKTKDLYRKEKKLEEISISTIEYITTKRTTDKKYKKLTEAPETKKAQTRKASVRSNVKVFKKNANLFENSAEVDKTKDDKYKQIKLMPQDIKTTRKLILTNLIEKAKSQQNLKTEERLNTMPKYINKEESESTTS